MKYTVLYERMKRYKTEDYHKYYRVKSQLYKRAVKMLQAKGGKNPVRKFYGYAKPLPMDTIIRKGLVIAKRDGK